MQNNLLHEQGSKIVNNQFSKHQAILKSSFGYLILALLFTLVLNHPVDAQLKSFDITFSNSNTGADITLGWEFQANQNLIVSALGFFDLDADGLLASHQVGLWSSSGTLLGSVTVTPASSPSGGFYYENLTTPINLTSGNSYRIAAHVLGDGFVYGGENIVTESNITFSETYRGFPGFTFPTENDGRQYLTSNFKVQLPPAVKSFDITFSNSNTGADMTLGWEFQTNANINVTALGFFDLDADGLLASHQVGLWNSSGTLLGSVTVTPSSSPSGGFYYENLTTPINLPSGNTYRIAAHVLGDGFVYGADNIVTDPSITFGETYRGFPGFTFPTENDGRIYLTTNFLFELVALPEVTAYKTDALLNDINGNGLVDPGDKVKYTITISNSGTSDAINVVLSDTLDSNITLNVGSVVTSQGTIVSGNTVGDSLVTINIGTIPSSGSVTITFDVTVKFPLPVSVTSISNQGSVTGDNFTSIVTDDPDVGGSADPTVTPINHVLGAKKISYEITIPDCNNPPNSLIVDSGNFLEGETFTFPPYTLPAQYSAYQPYYNAFVGAEFGIPVGSLNEDIKFVINLNDICNNGLIDNPDTQEIIELLFLNVDIIGAVSGSHSPLEYYYFNDGKEAYIKLLMANITPLLDFLSFDSDLLIPFFTVNGLNPDFNGIRKEVDATYYTIYVRHFSEVKLGINNSVSDVKQQNHLTPVEYKLAQNYPNPFNPATRISYSIPISGHVTLKVMDILGNQIATLIDEDKSAGYYSLTWNAINLPSGFYIYRIQAGNFVETRKMLLLK